jgi:Fe-Mn family superoxide dismutase
MVLFLCFTLLLSLGKTQDVFKLPALPYAYDALEPHIDEQTMRIHHGKHHANYVAGLNGFIKTSGDSWKGDVTSLASYQSKTTAQSSAALRNNLGGHYNHAFFWVNLNAASESTEPSTELTVAIEDSFGSMDRMKEAFSKAALGRFGSGWAWLGVKADGKLAVTSTANQDNPLMTNLEYSFEQMVPILGLDVWEHAYYLKYQNKRADYVDAFWNVVNWKKVSRNYEKYAKNGEPVPPSPTGGGHAIEL